MPEKINSLIASAMSVLTGAAVLVLCSTIQKLIIGANPFVLKGYIVPLLFGGITGLIIGRWHYRIRKLNQQLNQRVIKLESFLPICSNCKRIRIEGTDPDKQDSWQTTEQYFTERTDSKFTHGICPECIKELYP